MGDQPKNGKLLQDFTDSMVYPEKIAGARHTLLVVDRATQTVKAIGYDFFIDS